MSKQEFLQRLREALAGEAAQSVIEENIRYYEEYIRTEVGKGLAEYEVTASIGDPRLIAKTIVQAQGGSVHEEDLDREQASGEKQEEFKGYFRYVDLSKWYWKLILAAALILFFLLVFGIVAGILGFLMPVIGPLLVILLIIQIVNGKRR